MSTGKWKRPHPRKTGAQLWALRKPSKGDNLLRDITKLTKAEDKMALIEQYNPFFYTFFKGVKHDELQTSL